MKTDVTLVIRVYYLYSYLFIHQASRKHGGLQAGADRLEEPPLDFVQACHPQSLKSVCCAPHSLCVPCVFPVFPVFPVFRSKDSQSTHTPAAQHNDAPVVGCRSWHVPIAPRSRTRCDRKLRPRLLRPRLHRLVVQLMRRESAVDVPSREHLCLQCLGVSAVAWTDEDYIGLLSE